MLGNGADDEFRQIGSRGRWKSQKYDAEGRFRSGIHKLSEIRILSQKNPLLVYGYVNNNRIVRAGCNVDHRHHVVPGIPQARTTRKSQLSSARKRIHSCGSKSTVSSWAKVSAA